MAENVAGWKLKYAGTNMWVHDKFPGAHTCFPRYATSADAVLQLLDANGGCFTYRSALNRVTYFKDRTCDHPYCYDGIATTFARAACFALLKAKGWTVEDAS